MYHILFKYCKLFPKNVKTFFDSKSLLKHILDIDNLMYYKLAITDIRIPQINGINFTKS